jgi:phosphoribosyl-AMP cyclohydrolase
MNEELVNSVKFDDKGLVPVVVQEYNTNMVLMLAYMNKEAILRTIETKLATYWSRSRQSYWVKGETSGHFQHVKEFYIDCDKDTLLLKVEQIGPACHTGETSCFYRSII